MENQQLQQEISKYHHDRTEQIKYALSLPNYDSDGVVLHNHGRGQSHEDWENEIIQKRKYSLPKDLDPEILGQRSRTSSNASNYTEYPLIMHKFDEYELAQHLKGHSVEISHNNDILSQLLRFGYEEDDILIAMENVNVIDKKDINSILKVLENENDNAIDIAFGDIMEDEMNQQKKEIERLKKSNNESKMVIHKLQRTIKSLRRKKREIERKYNDTETCTTITFFKWW